MASFYKLSTFILTILFSQLLVAQTTIDWQKNIGTQFTDDARKIFNDEEGNLVIMGTETHEDFTGNLREYLLVLKYDAAGNQIWKKYHDVAFETNSFAFYYFLGDHFYTVEHGQKLINVILDLSGNLVMYKLIDNSGAFHSYENLTTLFMSVDRQNVKTTASTTCAVQQSCYGPDSLTIMNINPIPDSNWNSIVWTFGMKQHLRTAPIQGHYDFAHNDIATDEAGNVYLLTQIERWDFQFCTDCNDQFIDAWNMIYRFNSEGDLVGEERLNITTAVVSNMSFLSVNDGNIVVKIDDINNSGNALLTSIYKTDYNLNQVKDFNLDRFYNHAITDAASNIYAVTNVYDPADPNIKGESDVLVSKFNSDGQLQWSSYFGGSNFDFPKGAALTNDGGIVFFANTESQDFDIDLSHGFQDMWLVKLTENSTAVKDGEVLEFSIYPNPASDYIQLSNADNIESISLYDLTGRMIISHFISGDTQIDLSDYMPGLYVLKATDITGRTGVKKFSITGQ